MNLTVRNLRDENDYWRIRDFIRHVFLLNGRREMSWHVARLDYWWARRHEFLPDTRIEDVVFIWETQEGQIAAVLHPEHKGIVFHQVHPGLRTPELEEQMLVVAEEHLAVPRPEGRQRLIVVADRHDQLRHDILLRQGYHKFEHPKATEHQRRRLLDEPIPQPPVASGYSVRALREDEIPARGLAAWKTTRDDEPYDDFVGWQWLLKVYQAPLYRRDLDIVALAPGGEVASYCTLWFDD
ncbi:MAG: GNAT family N-acetyltransferase, partial [Anaerolineae bacterium]